jgi:hypothetical protein
MSVLQDFLQAQRHDETVHRPWTFCRPSSRNIRNLTPGRRPELEEQCIDTTTTRSAYVRVEHPSDYSLNLPSPVGVSVLVYIYWTFRFRTKYISAGVPPTHPQALRSNGHRMEILYPLQTLVEVRIWRLELMAGTSIIYSLYTRVTVTFEFVQLVCSLGDWQRSVRFWMRR